MIDWVPNAPLIKFTKEKKKKMNKTKENAKQKTKKVNKIKGNFLNLVLISKAR